MSFAAAATASMFCSWIHHQSEREEAQDKSSAHCCGIIGVVGNADSGNAVPILLEGLTVLQNRGYDSAGMATLKPTNVSSVQTLDPQKTPGSSLITTKYANNYGKRDSLARLRRDVVTNHGHATCGIAHTRWATQGSKIDANAHPHQDQHGRVAVVHNGSIFNAYELRKELNEQGIVFRSDTDTEIIAQLIGVYLDQDMSVYDATKAALERLHGTWVSGMRFFSGLCQDAIQLNII